MAAPLLLELLITSTRPPLSSKRSMHVSCTPRLCFSCRSNGWWGVPIANGSRAAATRLERADNLVRSNIAVSNAAEDDVLAVEPRGDDSGNEELRAVAASD